MHVEVIPNRNSKPAILLRESYREDGKVKKRTLANLSSLPMEQVEGIRLVLKGRTLLPVEELFEIVEGGSRHHGHADAVVRAMKQLDFAKLIAAAPSRQRDLVVAMVASRLVDPKPKLATTNTWHTTTIPETFGVADADEDDLYAAMDWLLERQGRIEKKLAARHLRNDGIAMYDLTSSYFEGVTCPLAKLGYSRDGKKGKLQVNYGLLTNERGVPVSVSVFEGNTGDPKTLFPQVEKVRDAFGIERFVLVGDRGMITQTQINALRELDGIDWIAALRPEALKMLVTSEAIQPGLFDQHNLFELTHPDFEGERLVACRNPALAKRRADKRQRLLEATTKELNKVRKMVGRGRLLSSEQIAEQVHKVLKLYKVGKCYRVDIREDGFQVELDDDKLAAQERDSGTTDQTRQKRREQRRRHTEIIAKKLEKVRLRIKRGQLHGEAAIGLRIGKVLDKYSVGKHFELDIEDNRFDFHIAEDRVTAEAALDGLYVVRTSLTAERLSADDTVRSYKQLSQVERAFRSLKTIDLHVRPIHHRLERRVRAHILLCMLSYYVLWHMLEAWRPLLFADEEIEAKATRDPVAPAQRSEGALKKAQTKRLEDGSRVLSFKGLMKHLSTIVRNRCRRLGAHSSEKTFDLDTRPDAKQSRAYELLRTITV